MQPKRRPADQLLPHLLSQTLVNKGFRCVGVVRGGGS
jgi:hypothetical protein